MTDRKLLEQALEALEHCLHYAQTHLQDFDAAYNRHPSAENERGVITDDIEDTFAAITALRERLAQPARCKYGNEPTSCTSSPMDCQCALDAVFEQPAQQPLTLAERNKLAAWMIQRSYATGHGDTVEDLLQELEWQIRESEREACAQIADTAEPYKAADLIRARGQA